MIDLYTAATPNGQKIHIMLEELGLEYRVVWVRISKGEQFAPAFLEVSPNNKIPAIVDRDGPDGEPVSVFESGAILLYLAEKTGRFLPSAPRARLEVLQCQPSRIPECRCSLIAVVRTHARRRIGKN